MDAKYSDEIVETKLKQLGFTYKMGFWRKGNVTLNFYKYIWKISAPKIDATDIISMKELYNKYWELTGEILKPLT